MRETCGYRPRAMDPSETVPSGDTPNCAERLKALADETRLSVVRHLMKGACHVGEIQLALGIEQSLLSHHLRSLRDAGIVQASRDGKAVLYRLTPDLERSKAGVVDLGCCHISFPDDRK